MKGRPTSQQVKALTALYRPPDPGNERAPAAGDSRGAGKPAGKQTIQKHLSTQTGVDLLLDRLEGVRKAGSGWIAKCPAHDDRKPSLSIAEGSDGTVLIKCFGGCGAGDIVAAIGLELGDLFPRRFDASLSSDAKRKLSQETRISRQWAALGSVLPELAVIEVAARQVAAGEPLATADAQRVSTALDRIHRTRMAVQEGIR